jgi:PAS domain S-box-containing protein
MRTLLLRLFILSFLFISMISYGNERKRVLYISSYNSSFPSFFHQLDGIKSVLDSLPVDIDIEFMDSKRFQDAKTKELFTQSLVHKLSHGINYDVIMAADDNALEFVLAYQDSLFKQLPIVFFGINNKQMALLQDENEFITGIIEEISMQETIESMVKLFPKYEKLYAIVDRTNSGQKDLLKFHTAIKTIKNTQYEIIDLDQITFKNYSEKLRSIPVHDPVLLISAYTDKTGKTINFDEIMEILNTNLQAPLFHLWYHGMGKGILGGKLVSHFEQGKNAATLVQKILNGTSPKRLKILDQSPNVFLFDYNKLEEFNISKDKLPLGALIYNEPTTFYKENKFIIHTSGIIIIFLLTFIFLQFRHTKKIKKINIELLDQHNENKRLKNRQSALIGNISDVIGIIDKDGIIRYKSDNIKTLFGYEPEELIGKPWHTTVAQYDKQRLEKVLFKIIQTKEYSEKVEFYYLASNGNHIPVELTATNKFDNPYINGVLINYHDISMRQNFELELKASESKYRLLAESAHHLIILHDLSGTIKYINHFGEKILGFKKEQIIGTPIQQFLNPEEIEEQSTMIKKALNGEIKNHTTSFKIENPESNQTIYLRMIANPVYREKKITEILVTAYNVTDIKIAEQKLIESEKKYRILIENQTDLIIKYDKDLKVSYASPNYFKTFGLKEDEVINKSFAHLIHEEDLELAMNSIHTTIDSGKETTHEVKVKTPHGWRWFAWSLNRLDHEESKEIEIIAVGRDITDRKETQEQLKNSEEKFRGAFLTSPDAVTVTKLNGEYVEVNNGFERITGYTKEEVIGKTANDINIWVNTVDREKLVTQLKEKGIVENMETSLRLKDGTLIPALLSAKFIYLNNETHILIVTREIRERKKMEEDLRRAKELAEASNRLKTEFLHNMSHEIRSPMNGIIGFSRMLTKKGISDKKQEYYTKIIQNSSYQLLKIIDDILEISTLETKQLKAENQPLNLNDFLLEQFSIFNLKAQENKLHLYLNKNLKDKQSEIMIDKVKLGKVVSNLVENAIRYTNKGNIEIGYTIEDQNLSIYVKDTGIGIPKEKQKLIFERFSQGEDQISKKSGGLGLGLSISKENAELMGGTILVESEFGKGSTFTLQVPYLPVEQNIPELDISDKKIFNILIVEDDETNFMFYEALLEEELDFPYKLKHAYDGQEAIDLCSSNNTFDLILMDIKLPRVNGYDATRIIKSTHPQIPIIAQTAYTIATRSDKFKNAKFDAFLDKPIDKEQLISLIKRFLKY